MTSRLANGFDCIKHCWWCQWTKLNVCVDDWTAERATIASNVALRRLKNAEHFHLFWTKNLPTNEFKLTTNLYINYTIIEMYPEWPPPTHIYNRTERNRPPISTFYRVLFNSYFHLIRRKSLPKNDFELTVPDLYTQYNRISISGFPDCSETHGETRWSDSIFRPRITTLVLAICYSAKTAFYLDVVCISELRWLSGCQTRSHVINRCLAWMQFSCDDWILKLYPLIDNNSRSSHTRTKVPRM